MGTRTTTRSCLRVDTEVDESALRSDGGAIPIAQAFHVCFPSPSDAAAGTHTITLGEREECMREQNIHTTSNFSPPGFEFGNRHSRFHQFFSPSPFLLCISNCVPTPASFCLVHLFTPSFLASGRHVERLEGRGLSRGLHSPFRSQTSLAFADRTAPLFPFIPSVCPLSVLFPSRPFPPSGYSIVSFQEA